MLMAHINQPLSRRALLTTGSLALVGFALGCSRRSEAAGSTGKVAIVEFSNDGKRLRSTQVDKLVRTDAAWKQQLSPQAYDVARRGGTERPYSGSLLNVHGKGVFRCICCDTALFDAATKFESGTGWPSFWQPIARGNVVEHRDVSLGMVRTEVLCTRCDAHLGHVFDDGPKPTGLRYCMNSVAMRFAAAA